MSGPGPDSRPESVSESGAGAGHPALPAVGLVVLVLVGSCLGFAPGGDRTGTPMVTPAPVPSTDPATPSTVAPGIAADGTVDTPVVVARHRQALSNRSYTVTVRRTVTRGGETRRETYARSWVAPSGEFRLVQYVNVSRRPDGPRAPQPVTDIWYNGSWAFFRQTDSTGTPHVRLQTANRTILPDPLFGPVLRDGLSVARLRPSGSGDRPLELVSASPVNRSVLDPPPSARTVRNVSVRVTLARNGVVRVVRVGYDATADGDRVHVVRTVRVSGLGETTVPSPPWYVSTTQ